MILGLVRWTQPVHGYDVRRELLSWSADRWANVQPGSIYHALRKLTEDGLLREVATEQVGARPARTTYEITPKGEEEFQNLLRGAWWTVEGSVDPFFAAFSFLPALSREEAAAALRNRARMLHAANESLRAAMESGWMSAGSGKPPHVAGCGSSRWLARRGRSPGVSRSRCRWRAGRATCAGGGERAVRGGD